MKLCTLILVFFCLIGCTNKVTTEQITLLNGYWEIAEVTFADGKKKEYLVNTSIDYIELNKMKGFKKKVSPKIDGSYDTSNDAEKFIILKKNDEYLFSYKNNLSQWQEVIQYINEDTFSIKNEANITYTYKRFVPLNIE